jgi:hypothetical protein
MSGQIGETSRRRASSWAVAPLLGMLASLNACSGNTGGSETVATDGAPLLTGPTTFLGLNNGGLPDTVGEVGADHFVQIINGTPFGVWDKTGAVVSGPTQLGSLWTTGTCAGNTTGDPIVTYDHLADRWVLLQFTGRFGNSICAAVSRTGVPGTLPADWFTYEFIATTTPFPDYPKLGLWDNAYYMTTYEGVNLGLYALDRAGMLAGTTPAQVTCAASGAACLKMTIPSLTQVTPPPGQFAPRETRILPPDLDGPAPPAGTPAPFVRTVDDQQDVSNQTDRVEIFEATADFTAQTFTVTQQPDLPAAAFAVFRCNRNATSPILGPGYQGFRDCIPQPGEDTLDALGHRPMMAARYRTFAGFSSMVFVQTVDVQASFPGVATGEVAGLRWYELRNTSGTWSIQDQGDFAPQNGPTTNAELIHRWMGSAAMDQQGNIVIGYSAVNSDTDPGDELFPSLFYAGRLATDPPGTLGSETLIEESAGPAGANDGSLNTIRWGDYSAMSVDPEDNCQFWFTSHMADYSTRVSNFEFTECNNPPVAVCQDVTVSADENCQADVDAADIDAGSFDIDGDLVNCTLSPSGPFGLTPTVVTLTCTDPSGASDDCTATVTVEDDTPPVLNCPVSVNVPCTNSSGAVANFTATATDNCGATPPPSCTPPSGSTFPLGTTLDTCTVQDSFGNAAACSFNVTVALGDNPVCCPAGTNVMLGDSNNNPLNGTFGSDCILGRGGQDTINGNGGNDFISGGDGDDIVNAGSGSDLVFGGTGQDRLTGGTGNDVMSGGDGDDQCFGGDGNDTLLGGQGQDRLLGENNDDTLVGETGDDRLEGGDGNDSLNGSGLHDVCIGGPGTDTFLVCETQTQ